MYGAGGNKETFNDFYCSWIDIYTIFCLTQFKNIGYLVDKLGWSLNFDVTSNHSVYIYMWFEKTVFNS